VPPSCGRKRKRHTTNTPEGGIGQPSSGGKQNTPDPSNGLEAKGASLREEQRELYNETNISQVQVEETIHFDQHASEDEQGQGADDFWDDDETDEHAGGGCVEGLIEDFLHGEENRKFRSKVWNEFSKIRVAGVVTKGQCIHCNAEISAKRGAGTSAMITHLKRCKERKNVTNMARQLKSVVMSPEGVALEKWRFGQEVSRRELTRMITLHGLPLALVDYDGFRRFVSA
jgi:hypothetical protein